jgi:hypothetical protein
VQTAASVARVGAAEPQLLVEAFELRRHLLQPRLIRTLVLHDDR